MRSVRCLRLFAAITAMAFATPLHAAPADPKPAADKPAADKPAADKPAADKPAADKPAADKPAAGKTTVIKGKPGKAAPEAKPLAPGEVGSHTGKIPGLGVTMDVKSFALQNGLRVFVLEDHTVPTLSLQMIYNVGSRDEEQGRTGFAHFFEHMMFKGSENVADGGHFKYVLGTGGQMNAFTSNDFTLYFDVLPSQYLDLGLWLESDRLRSLAITDENFENQRKAVQEEKAMRVDNVPYARAVLDFFADAWKGTGYGHHAIGSDADLQAAKTADVKAFFDKYYVPNNAVMVLVGDVDFAEVQTKVEKYFGSIPRGTDRTPFGAVDHTQTKIEKRIEDHGADVETSTPEQLGALVKSEIEKWKGVVNKAKLTAD